MKGNQRRMMEEKKVQKMACRFIIVRHGQTYWNKAGKFQGQVNIPLNETGRIQAGASAEELAGQPIEVCFSSPLDRAMETAAIICRPHGLRPQANPLLLERNYGIYEGESFLMAFANPGHELYSIKDPVHYRDQVITVESYSQILQRAQRIIDEIMLPSAEKYDCVLLAGHCDIFCALFSRLFEVPLADYWKQALPNAGYAIIDYADGYFTEVEVSG